MGLYVFPSGYFLATSGGTVSGLTTFTSGISGSTISGGTIYSGNTDLYDIFVTTAGANDITRVQTGINIFTGGTNNYPTVNITSATLANLSTSGTNVADTFSATTISSSTIFVSEQILPTNDNVVDIGTPIRRFRNLNTVNGIAVNFTATTIQLGSRTITENNIILTGDTIDGGNY